MRHFPYIECHLINIIHLHRLKVSLIILADCYDLSHEVLKKGHHVIGDRCELKLFAVEHVAAIEGRADTKVNGWSHKLTYGLCQIVKTFIKAAILINVLYFSVGEVPGHQSRVYPVYICCQVCHTVTTFRNDIICLKPTKKRVSHLQKLKISCLIASRIDPHVFRVLFIVTLSCD